MNREAATAADSAVRANPREPSVTSALEHVLDASQHVIVDQIDLLRYETFTFLSEALRYAPLVGIGGILAGGGWFAAMAVIVLFLNDYIPPAASVAVVAVLCAGTGAIFIRLGLHHLTRLGKMRSAQ